MSNELIQQGTEYSIDKCLTNQCNDCSGTYVNKLIDCKLRCKCKCHNKKMLEQQVVGPACSNTNSVSEFQQPEVLLND